MSGCSGCRRAETRSQLQWKRTKSLQGGGISNNAGPFQQLSFHLTHWTPDPLHLLVQPEIDNAHCFYLTLAGI